MTDRKLIVTQRAAMARLRRKLLSQGENYAVGYHRIKGYYLVEDGFLMERGSYTDFEAWCRRWEVLKPYEALER